MKSASVYKSGLPGCKTGCSDKLGPLTPAFSSYYLRRWLSTIRGSPLTRSSFQSFSIASSIGSSALQREDLTQRISSAKRIRSGFAAGHRMRLPEALCGGREPNWKHPLTQQETRIRCILIADRCGALNVFVDVVRIRSDAFWFSAVR